MKKSVKIVLIVAACLVGVGMIISLIGGLFIRVDFSKGFSFEHTSQTIAYEELASFENIKIDLTESDVKILRSSEGKTHVVCNETDKVYHDVYVEDGTLCVTRTDVRRWFENFGFYELNVTVYLPDGLYGSIEVGSVSGDVCVGEGLAFSSIQIDSTSGDIEMRGCEVGAKAEIRTTSGDVGVSGITAAELFAKSSSGEIELEGVTVSDSLEIKTTSGDIDIEDSDAYSICIESTSGDVEGTLLSGKDYIVDTTSGSVRVPASTADAGECRINTTSGDIMISER